jgi:hypothetical protein
VLAAGAKEGFDVSNECKEQASGIREAARLQPAAATSGVALHDVVTTSSNRWSDYSPPPEAANANYVAGTVRDEYSVILHIPGRSNRQRDTVVSPRSSLSVNLGRRGY